MDYVILFGIKIPINNVAFTIPGTDFNIYWYGILIALGFSIALVYALRNAEHHGIDKDKMIDVVLVGFVTAIIGARGYYVIFSDHVYTSFREVIAIHDGGLAIYGGIIGALLGGGIMCLIRKVNVLAMFDLAMPGFLIGQSIGRWGNFLNQEAYGYATGSDWFGMTGSKISQVMGEELVHPCFLYESLWCAACFFLLWRISKNRKFDGQIFSLYMILYSAGRFFIEGLRTDSLYIDLIFVKMRVSQVLAAALVLAGIILYLVLRARERRIHDDEYVQQFEDDSEVKNGTTY